MIVENRTGSPDEPLAPLRETLASQTTMERALAWFFSHSPPLAPEDLIAADEFWYDLIVPFREWFLSYDTS